MVVPCLPEPRPDWGFLVDLDGTLIDIARSPSLVHVEPELIGTLGRLSEVLGGALAVVTGRRIVQVDKLLYPLRLTVTGVHGTQIRRSPNGEAEELVQPAPPELVERIRAMFRDDPGIIVEPKEAAVAVHYRAAPSARATIERKLAEVVASEERSMMLSHGRMVFELLPTSYSKGTAVEALCALPMFVGRLPVMIGDDVADEDAFEAAEKLGGIGLRVAGEHFPAHVSNFTGPGHVRTWLGEVVGILASSSQRPQAPRSMPA